MWERTVRSFGVVDGGELVEQDLDFVECLVEAFDFAAGGRVVGATVLLVDAEAVEFGFEAVAATATSRESRGVDHAVISVDAGMPCSEIAARNSSTTMRPVTRVCAVSRNM
jgi:hypothetical protein